MNVPLSRKQSRRIFDLLSGGVVLLIVGLGLARSRLDGNSTGANTIHKAIHESLIVEASTNVFSLPQAN